MKKFNKLFLILAVSLLTGCVPGSGVDPSTCIHNDRNGDHKCDYCGTIISSHSDRNKDHICDSCGVKISECLDESPKDHKCDICGKTVSQHTDNNHDHSCDVCSEVISSHKDDDENGLCDICGSNMSIKPTGTVTIDLYGINDFHGAVTTEIGLINLGTYMKSKTDQPNTLFIDSGDTWQGSAESNLNRGKLITDVFSYAKLTSRTIGNHDFDWGIDALKANSARSYNGYTIPTLGANIYDYDFDNKVEGNIQQSDLGKKYIVKTLENGLKVGIIGVIGKDQITSICTNLVEDICFKDHIQTIKDLSDYLRTEEECDLIIASEHDAYDSEEDVLTSISNISHKKYVDFVFNGHSHQNVEYTVNDVTFAQCGGYGDAVGHAKLTYDFSTESVTTDYEVFSTDEIKSQVNKMGVNSTIKTIVDTYNAETNQIGSEVLTTFNGSFKKAPQLANLMCEAIYLECVEEGYDVDFVYCNNAREDFYATNNGKSFTFKDLYASFPFDNTVYIIKGKGPVWGEELSSYNYVYNTGISSIDNNTEYTIAALDYLAYHTGVDRNYDYFPGAIEVGYLHKADGSIYNYRDLLADYLRDNKSSTFYASDYASSKSQFTRPSYNPIIVESYHGTPTDRLTVTQALKDVAKNECISSGLFSTGVVYCKGTVTEIGSKQNYGYKEVVVSDGINSILIYTLNVSNGDTIKVGDTILFHGYIKNHYGTIEFATNGSEYVYLDSIL